LIEPWVGVQRNDLGVKREKGFSPGSGRSIPDKEIGGEKSGEPSYSESFRSSAVLLALRKAAFMGYSRFSLTLRLHRKLA